MYEFTRGRFIDPKRIIGANIYKKDVRDAQGQSTGTTEIRVAIDLETSDPKGACVYAGPFESEEHARNYIASLPVK